MVMQVENPHRDSNPMSIYIIMPVLWMGSVILHIRVEVVMYFCFLLHWSP